MVWYWLTVCVRYCKRSCENRVDRMRPVVGLEASATQVCGIPFSLSLTPCVHPCSKQPVVPCSDLSRPASHYSCRVWVVEMVDLAQHLSQVVLGRLAGLYFNPTATFLLLQPRQGVLRLP